MYQFLSSVRDGGGINFYLLVLLVCSNNICAYSSLPSYRIMIHPAGDAKDPGRIIEHSFERTIAIDFTTALTSALQLITPHSTIIPTRSPGDIIHPLQNATFANRLAPDLFISLHFFHATDKNSITLCSYTSGDTFIPTHTQTTLTFIPLHKAFIKNYEKTSHIGKTMVQALKNQQKITSFILYGLYTFPCAPLLGIQAPSLVIEMGITHDDAWKSFVEPLALALKASLDIV